LKRAWPVTKLTSLRVTAVAIIAVHWRTSLYTNSHRIENADMAAQNDGVVFDDLPGISEWGFTGQSLRYRAAGGGARMASQAVTTRVVNAAYTTSASIFVKKYMALHDRKCIVNLNRCQRSHEAGGIKNAINTMAKQVQGRAIDNVTAATEESWNLKQTMEFKNPRGMLLLRPIGIRGRPYQGGPETVLHPINKDDASQQYNQLKKVFTVVAYDVETVDDNPPQLTQNRTEVRSHTSIRWDASSAAESARQKVTTFKENDTGASDSMNFPSVYTLVKGQVSNVGQHVKIPEDGLAATLWELITKDTWSVGLPERETLQIKGYVAHARDSRTFAAMRLDLLDKETLQGLVKVYEEAADAGVSDFDKQPLPFEERLHEDNSAGFLARLDYLAKWITLCLFDRPVRNPGDLGAGAGILAGGAARDERRAGGGGRDVPPASPIGVEAYGSSDFWRKMLMYRSTPGAYKPFEAALSEAPFGSLDYLIRRDANARRFLEGWNGETSPMRDNFKNSIKLHNVEDQMPIEKFPYVLPIVDMSKGFCWGSTVSPFLLALIGAAWCVARHAKIEREQGLVVEIRPPRRDQQAQPPPPAPEHDPQRCTEEVPPEFTGNVYETSLRTIEISHAWFWKNFAGIHYSNRKSLHNGVYAVMFPDSDFFQERFDLNFPGVTDDDTQNGGEDGGGALRPPKIRLFVRVHGRFPVSLDSPNLIGVLYSMIEEVRRPRQYAMP
jgi:hypothetical protein